MPAVIGIHLHELTGQPHAIRHLEAIYDHVLKHPGVLVWNGREIYDWYATAPEKFVGPLA